MNTPIVSIIIPVYNVEQYLPCCIESVLSQTYTNFELLLIDDGSPDYSGKICDEYASKDKRIRVFHKENGGVSTARNIGLDNAKGEWCCFIDSDDWVDVNYLAHFIQAIDSDTQLVLQGFWQEIENTHTSQKVILPNKIIESNNELVQWLEDAKGVHNGFLWHRFFRMDIIHKEKLRFEVGISFAEDGWFFFRYLRQAGHFVMTSALGYHYRIHGGSLTSTEHERTLTVSERVFRGFVESLYAFSVPDAKRIKHLFFVRRYMWRLASSWFVERAYRDKAHKKECLQLVCQLVRDYRLDKVEGIDKSLRWLINAVTWNDSIYKDSVVRFLLFYRKYKQKIVSHL